MDKLKQFLSEQNKPNMRRHRLSLQRKEWTTRAAYRKSIDIRESNWRAISGEFKRAFRRALMGKRWIRGCSIDWCTSSVNSRGGDGYLNICIVYRIFYHGLVINRHLYPTSMDDAKVEAGTKSSLVLLTLARKISAITFSIWKKGERYNEKKLKITHAG